MRKTKYVLLCGTQSCFYVKENGKYLAGFMRLDDARLFLKTKIDLCEGGHTVEDQTG